MEITLPNLFTKLIKVTYDYSAGYFTYKRRRYLLEDYKKYLIKYYSELCLKYVLRSLPIGNKMYKRAFAWDTIYYHARKKGILIDYIITQTPEIYEREPERPTEPTV